MSEVGERNTFGLAKAERYRILTQYRTIAMVGLSTNYYNASSFAAIYLDANGYDIVPVNPVRAGQEILGRPVYADLEPPQRAILDRSTSWTFSDPPTKPRRSPSRPSPSERRSCGSNSV